MEVLVTGFGDLPGRFVGRTSCNRIVHFTEGASVPIGTGPTPGSLVRVRIERAMPHSLTGVPVSEARSGTPRAAGGALRGFAPQGGPRLPVLSEPESTRD